MKLYFTRESSGQLVRSRNFASVAKNIYFFLCHKLTLESFETMLQLMAELS